MKALLLALKKKKKRKKERNLKIRYLMMVLETNWCVTDGFLLILKGISFHFLFCNRTLVLDNAGILKPE